jgi:hypothetical protein
MVQPDWYDTAWEVLLVKAGRCHATAAGAIGRMMIMSVYRAYPPTTHAILVMIPMATGTLQRAF